MRRASAVGVLLALGGAAAIACAPSGVGVQGRVPLDVAADGIVDWCDREQHVMLVSEWRSGRVVPPNGWAVVSHDEEERAIDMATSRWLEEVVSLRSETLKSPYDKQCCGARVMARQWLDHPEAVMRIAYDGRTVSRRTMRFVEEGGAPEAARIAHIAEVRCVGDGDLVVVTIAAEPPDHRLCTTEGPSVHAWYWAREAVEPAYIGARTLSGRCPRDVGTIDAQGRALTLTFFSLRTRAEHRPCDTLVFDLPRPVAGIVRPR